MRACGHARTRRRDYSRARGPTPLTSSHTAIDSMAKPKTLDDADKFGSSGKAGEVKNQVMDKVGKGKEDSAKDVKEKSSEPPDPSKVKIEIQQPDLPPPLDLSEPPKMK